MEKSRKIDEYTTAEYNEQLIMHVAKSEEDIIWVPIKGYEGSYSINQFGQVKSHDRVVERSNGTQYHVREKLLIIIVINDDHHNVSLYKEGRLEHLYIPRLLAEAFLGLDRNNKSKIVRYKNSNRKKFHYKHLVIDDINWPKTPVRRWHNNKYTIECCNVESGESISVESIAELVKHCKAPYSTVLRYVKKNKQLNGWSFKVTIHPPNSVC